MTQDTGYITRDKAMELLKAERGTVRTLQDELKGSIAQVETLGQEKLALVGEIHSLKEALEGYESRLSELEAVVTESEKVIIGCPENHPFKPLAGGYVHLLADGRVQIFCSRGHFDRWFTG